MPPEGFSSYVLHDMANAIHTVAGVADTFARLRHELTDEEVDRLVLGLGRQAAVLQRLVADLADLEALASGRFSVTMDTVPLRDAVVAAIGESGCDADAVHVRVGEDVDVMADPDRLQQVLVNLLTNARVHGGPNVWLEADRRGAHVVLTVSDDGAGLLPEDADHLFEAHRRGADAAGRAGRGLGLAIVHGLVEAFGGTVRYVRRPRGSQFVLRLEAASSHRRASPDAVPAPFDHAAMLYTDDHQLEAEIAALVRAGLDAGDGIVLVLTPEHWRAVSRRLTDRRAEVARAFADGQLVVDDAATLLARFHHDDLPDAEGFERIVGGLVADVADRHGDVRIFGEMVDLLWGQGEVVAALALEDLWNRLWAERPFTLLCGYRTTDGIDPGDASLQGVHDHHGLVFTE